MAVARLMSVREAVAVVRDENSGQLPVAGDMPLTCPECGACAASWRERWALFRRLHRPEPQDGVAYPQVWRCVRCGYLFGEPYAASIEAGP